MLAASAASTNHSKFQARIKSAASAVSPLRLWEQVTSTEFMEAALAAADVLAMSRNLLRHEMLHRLLTNKANLLLGTALHGYWAVSG